MSNPSQKTDHALREERILRFWEENKIFEKSLNKKSPKGEFTFYDGPPFATGLPHYGHLLAGTMKDVIPRFKTMQGYHVSRKWGWDCHGLPIENLIEKELGLKTKKDIINYGIGNFNDKARNSVMRYADEWRKIVPRMGRFIDMDNDYRTMDATYTESVWWIFKKLYEKGLIYEGFKSMHLCPRCETTLSNFEVAQGYKDITDISVYVKFKTCESTNYADATNKTEGTYLLAWTTTPWTLPGNVALAVNTDIDYCKIKMEGDNAVYILAESRLGDVLKEKKYSIIGKVKGSELVGLSYSPLFDYYANDKSQKNGENGWKVYGADFVTTEDGTGIVHIAPAFGSDDYELSKRNNLPFVQHVSPDGSFKDEWVNTKELQDLGLTKAQVKPKPTEENKNAHQDTDVKIIKYLAHQGHLFEKEKLIHAYPHCWRCDTPLINYATSSWFVRVTDLKDRLIAENRKVAWVPEELGSGRFGNWLENVRDWAISRSRFWGAPIPVWKKIKNQKSKIKNEDQNSKIEEIDSENDYVVIGSVEDLKKYSKSKNTYYVIRHGEAENNVLEVLSGDRNYPHHLTEKGRGQVQKASESLKNIGFDLVFVSPFVRTRETAKIIAETMGISIDKVIIDDRLCEFKMGEWNGKTIEEYDRFFDGNDWFLNGAKDGETYAEAKKRVGDFLYELENKYDGNKILIVTHQLPAVMFRAVACGMNRKQTKSFLNKPESDIRNADPFKLDFVPLPHNDEYELELHRPFIDEIDLKTENGNKLVRVPDVFDCWFESGAMPIASNHYPFEKDSEFRPLTGYLSRLPQPLYGLCNKFGCSSSYPADFIAEGQDQTRGWFYSMLVLGVALFGKSPYKKVLANGLVLAEDGQKMSKSKNNFPDPMGLINKYGADSLRFYLMSNPVVRAQDLYFSEKGVDEVTKKLVNRLLNVVSFYDMYKEEEFGEPRRDRGLFVGATPSAGRGVATPNSSSNNVLDRWIISRLNETIHAVTTGLETGELDRSARPILDLVDDLSTWYLRRSRDRFKGEDMNDKNNALATTKFVLLEISKVIAPFMPFLAEDVYQKIKNQKSKIKNEDQKVRDQGRDGNDFLSVHLEFWPTLDNIDTSVSESMEQVQRISSQGLEARTNAKINVRQPLAKLSVKQSVDLTPEFIELIKDEVNIKEVVFDNTIAEDIVLDTNITPELKEEGIVREILRLIQDARKTKGLTVNDKAKLLVSTDENLKKIIEKNKEMISRTTSLNTIEYGNVEGEGVKVGESTIKIVLK